MGHIWATHIARDATLIAVVFLLVVWVAVRNAMK
jgi:hypothetical protein